MVCLISAYRETPNYFSMSLEVKRWSRPMRKWWISDRSRTLTLDVVQVLQMTCWPVWLLFIPLNKMERKSWNHTTAERFSCWAPQRLVFIGHAIYRVWNSKKGFNLTSPDSCSSTGTPGNDSHKKLRKLRTLHVTLLSLFQSFRPIHLNAHTEFDPGMVVKVSKGVLCSWHVTYDVILQILFLLGVLQRPVSSNAIIGQLTSTLCIPRDMQSSTFLSFQAFLLLPSFLSITITVTLSNNTRKSKRRHRHSLHNVGLSRPWIARLRAWNRRRRTTIMICHLFIKSSALAGNKEHNSWTEKTKYWAMGLCA